MDDLTRAAGQATRAPATRGRPRSSSSSGTGWGRFAPGTLLAGRFRIVAPLGRGGMGEVYRADDLKLGQTVALKFLPDDLMHDPARLAQFHNEVRVARTISHRNVCRTYDIGDADGRPFLTMEYVDGEDLSSLLRRIGRFPQEKAIEVARQICAGVAAAHERGVLHRDLKPANVMIDGEGRVRLTDFGLAAIAGSVDNIRAGTPAYMAPEQLAGREVTPRSDIYALGLVLFELFTGKRVFEAATLNELIAAARVGGGRDALVAGPRSRSDDRAGDPALPRARAGQAARVGARGVGGAARRRSAGGGAGRRRDAVAGDGRRRRRAERAAAGHRPRRWSRSRWSCSRSWRLPSQRFGVIHRIPLPKSTDSLHDRAQEMLERLGYRDAPYDTVHGWMFRRDYLDWAAGEHAARIRARRCRRGRTGTVNFWYRTSPAPMVVGDQQPAADERRSAVRRCPTCAWCISTRMDGWSSSRRSRRRWTTGRGAAAAPDWAAAVRRRRPARDRRFTRSSRAGCRAATPTCARAWEGPLPEMPGMTLRVEAAGVSRPADVLQRGRAVDDGRRASSRRGPRRSGTVLGDGRQRHRRADHDRRRRFSPAGICAPAAAIARGAFRTATDHLRRAGRGAAAARAALRIVRHRESGACTDLIGVALFSATIDLAALHGVRAVRAPLLADAADRLDARCCRATCAIRWWAATSWSAPRPAPIAALLTASRELIPDAGRAARWRHAGLPQASILLGTRYEMSRRSRRCAAPSTARFADRLHRGVPEDRGAAHLAGDAARHDRRSFPIAMNGSFAGEQLALELASSSRGIALIFGVLLRFGLLVADRHVLHIHGHGGAAADDGFVSAVRQLIGSADAGDRRGRGVRLLRLTRRRTALRPPAPRLIATSAGTGVRRLQLLHAEGATSS